MMQASVLIVDDEPLVRQTLSEWMKRINFRVFEADGGRQAMERIRRDEPDIVISDVVMPGMDGVELLKEARAVKADIPFLMISGYPSHSTALDIMNHGASDYLPKPFTPEELTRRVNRALLRKSASRKLAPAKGIILGAALSTVVWALIILALGSAFH
jgi:two-component system, NtrC family, C4-dicarboxylate transport response regulator DctD